MGLCRLTLAVERKFGGSGRRYAPNLHGDSAMDTRHSAKPDTRCDLTSQVLGIEGSDGHWSLVSRLMLANEVLDAADAAGRVCCQPSGKA